MTAKIYSLIRSIRQVWKKIYIENDDEEEEESGGGG